MLWFKRIDCMIQAGLIVAGIFYSIIVGLDFLAYFIVGAYQLLSCAVHFFLSGHYYPTADRRAYLQTVAWLAGITILCLAFYPLLLFMLLALTFVSPFLAGWYLLTCRKEYLVLKAKQFVHLM